MKLHELTGQLRMPVYLSNEERDLLKKLRHDPKTSKLNEREREIVLHSLKIKGLVEWKS